ncbi:hypothetical protein QQF64_015999 [Cirrhinus molitorella]|uniref:Secreted protein n=1 Tax=Cirrhinus molitorella TaxID=172907 RepID=A0ABR3LMZ7_9TELE
MSVDLCLCVCPIEAVTWITRFSKAPRLCFHAVCVTQASSTHNASGRGISRASVEVTIPSKGRPEDTLHQTTVNFTPSPVGSTGGG